MKYLSLPFLGMVLVLILSGCTAQSDEPLDKPDPEELPPFGECKALLDSSDFEAAKICYIQAYQSLTDTSEKAIFQFLSQTVQQFSNALAYDGSFYFLQELSSLFSQDASLLSDSLLFESQKLNAKTLVGAGIYQYFQNNNTLSDSLLKQSAQEFHRLIPQKPDSQGLPIEVLLEIYDDLGTIYSFLGYPDSTLATSKRSLKLIEQVEGGDWKREKGLLEVISYVYEYEASWDSAKVYAQKRLEGLFHETAGDTTNEIAFALSFLSKCFINEHKYDSALVLLEVTNRWIQSHPQEALSPVPFFNLFHLAEIFEVFGDYPRALEAYQQAITHIDSSRNYEADVLEKISPLYLEMGEFQASLEAASQSLAIRDFTSKIPDIQQRIADSYLNKGTALFSLGSMDAASACMDSAKAVIQNMEIVSRATKKYQGKLHQSQGELELKRGNFTEAEKYLSDAIEMYLDLYGSYFEGIGDCYLALANSAFAQGKYRLARNRIQQTLDAIIVRNEVPELQTEGNTSSELILSYGTLARALDLHAQILITQFRQTQDLEFLYNALAQYRLADGYLSSNLSQLATESSVLAFRNSWYFLYEKAVEASFLLAQQDPSSGALQLAYQYAEKSKAHVLRQFQQDTKAKIEAGLDSSLWNQETQLKRQIAFLRAARLEAPESTQDSLDREVYETTEEYIHFIKQLERTYPQYYRLKYDLTVSTLEEVQSSLAAHQSLIQFFEGSSRYFQFVILPDTTWLREIPFSPLFQDTLQQFQRLVSRDPLEDTLGLKKVWEQYGTYGYALYKRLFEPLQPLLPNDSQCMVVPDGALTRVPFSALLESPEIWKDEFPDPKFILTRWAFSYAFSGTTHLSDLAIEAPGKLQILGASPDFSGTRLLNLERATEGLVEIQSKVGGTYLLNNAATKAQYLQHIQDHGILYFATHAEMNPDYPLFSRLAFTPLEPPLDDNRDFLHAYELYNMPLSAKLAILGACETGVGTYEKSEGMMSLGRAFAYAGCPSIIMSLWKAQYIATALDILPGFVSHLKEGRDKAHALQQAKIDFLQQAQADEVEVELFPYAWATFISLGNQQSLALAEPTESYFPSQGALWVIGLILILLIGFVVWMLRRVA